MLSERDFIIINKELGESGKIVNNSSLDFSISTVNKTKDWVSQLAYLVRAIVVDHVFEDGNKRTGAAIIVAYAKVHKKPYDVYKVDRIIRDLSKNELKDFKELRRRIKNAIS